MMVPVVEYIFNFLKKKMKKFLRGSDDEFLCLSEIKQS